MRVRMAERVHGHAGREVHVTLAIARDQPNALAALESEVDARISRQNVRGTGGHRRNPTIPTGIKKPGGASASLDGPHGKS
jgi:hypothetical protein